MQKQMLEILKQRYPNFGYSKVSGTSHWNVIRVWNPFLHKYYIAKGIFDANNENFSNQNHISMNKSWEMETFTLASLPSWWRIQLIDSFQTGPIRIIITSEIPNLPWIFYKSSRKLDRQIALDLEKQLRWLLDNNISHNDLELKNILFTGSSAVIIDFEKATHSKGTDIDKIIDSFSERENTKGIASVLRERFTARRNITRRASMRRNI